MLTFKDEITNTGAATLQPMLYLQLTRDSHKPPGESQFYSTYTGPVVYTDKGKFQKVDFSDIEKDKATFEKSANDGWVGMIQHYFVTAWVPSRQNGARVLRRQGGHQPVPDWRQATLGRSGGRRQRDDESRLLRARRTRTCWRASRRVSN